MVHVSITILVVTATRNDGNSIDIYPFQEQTINLEKITLFTRPKDG